MTTALLIIISYICALAFLIVSNTSTDQKQKVNHRVTLSLFWLTLLLGISLHLFHSANTSYIQHSFNFSVASMTFWFSALVVGTFAIGSLIYPIKNLAIIVLPIAIICIFFALIWGDNPQIIDNQGSIFYWHIFTASIAFTLLSLSVLQAILFGYQEVSLRKHTKNTFLTWLPPIQTTEIVLFKSIIVGFVFLSASITLGSLYNFELNRTLLSFNHHTVLAILSWIGFAILLYGRIILGWRGLQAINWTIIAFLFLSIGYFGTKMINEVLIN